MDDARRFFVAEAPRRADGRLFHAASAAACLTWIRARPGGGATRLAIWAANPAPDDGPDAWLCLPVAAVEGWRDVAADVVERWEREWLLISSMPRRFRDDAREGLVGLLAEALAGAAAIGLDDGVDVGF